MSKYGNIKTLIDGITFASKLEAARYQELKLLLRAGKIFDLVLQPKFPVSINGKHICNYFADFSYRDKNNNLIIEDAKGVRTQVYVLKKKLVEAIHNIKIIEV